MTTSTAALVESVLGARGARLSGDEVLLGSRRYPLPPRVPLKDLDDMPSALPSRARGDSRDKTLYNIAQDLGGLDPKQRQGSDELRAALAGRVGADAGSRKVLASVMSRQYWVQPVAREGSSGSPFPTPFHETLPASLDYRGRYKSFRGSLLLFLCWDGTGFDLAAAESLLGFLCSNEGLTVLDRELLRVADDLRSEAGLAPVDASVSHLADSFAADMRARLAHGVMDQPALDRMRQDLVAILDLPLPRHDKVAALVQGVSLNLALYYYRVAFTLGAGLDSCVAAVGGTPPGPAPDFSGQVMFRVGSGDRPVSLTEACSTSFLELDARHLLALPASVVAANVIHSAAVATGLARAGATPDPHAVGVSAHDDPDAALALDAICAVLAIQIAEEKGDPEWIARLAAKKGTGAFALREAALDSFRARGSALKQRGRDVVHTLVGGYVGGLKRSRGRVSFFELGEEILYLLVHLILAASGERRISFRERFLPDLATYGLAPQDQREEDLLAVTLERLGLLRRFSDAGEALYVEA